MNRYVVLEQKLFLFSHIWKKYDTELLMIMKIFLLLPFLLLSLFIWILSNHKSFVKIVESFLIFSFLHFANSTSVSKCFKSETATFGAKTRQNPPQKFLPKNHLNFRPNRHNFRNFEVEKLNFLQIPLMFTEKCENIAFFLPAPKNFFRHKKVPNRQKPANPPLLPTLNKNKF